MANKRIYFCQGCSAVLENRVKFCPHCGNKQYYDDECEYCGAEISEYDEECPKCYETIKWDEDKTRYCPLCGYDLDIDGRNLNRKYCDGVDCGKEIGGLIRYSHETGEALSVDEILRANDYNREIRDWLESLRYGHSFDRMLYIYDKTGQYTGNNFMRDYEKTFYELYIHYIDKFANIVDDDILELFSEIKTQYCKNIFVLDISNYDNIIESHHFIECCKDSYYDRGEYDYTDIVRKNDFTIVFVSHYLPEQTKIGSMYDKHFLIITPEILETLDLPKTWKEIREKHLGT